MLSELCPRGYENMFFALFGLSNRASSLIGPNVVAAIINVTGNNWMGFTFLFGICAVAGIAIWFVDVEAGRADCRRFTETRKAAGAAREAGMTEQELLSRAAQGDLM